MRKYKILAVITVLIYFLQSFFISFGGIVSDSLSYFGISGDLPYPETNLFPLGYPLLLKLFHLVFSDYFWSYKILNLFFTVTILIFSYSKKFFFRETVLLFAGKTFFYVFTQAVSESAFIFIFYFLIYFLFQMLNKPEKLYKNCIWASCLMVGLFTVRYSGIFIYVGILIFSVLKFRKIRNEMYSKGIVLFLILSGLGISGYLFFNYLEFGSFTGEQLRGAPAGMSLIYIVRDLLGVGNVINPFIGIKPASNSFGSLLFQGVIFVLDIFIFIFFFRYYKKAEDTPQRYFHVLLWVVSVVYAFALLFSGWVQQIEEMGIRLLVPANFCLFFSFLILYFKYSNNDRNIWRITCFFLFFLTVYSLKDPAYYLASRNVIKDQMPKFKNKKYLYNNEGNIRTLTKYEIPVIHKTFEYEHTNKQKGKLKEGLAGSVDPKIKWLKYDTVSNKSEVLYTSQLYLE
nr:hypothetical protein [uncultured Chryseobacterium sp.]